MCVYFSDHVAIIIQKNIDHVGILLQSRLRFASITLHEWWWVSTLCQCNISERKCGIYINKISISHFIKCLVNSISLSTSYRIRDMWLDGIFISENIQLNSFNLQLDAMPWGISSSLVHSPSSIIKQNIKCYCTSYESRIHFISTVQIKKK